MPCTPAAPCPEERAEPFEMKTTEQAYREFPLAVRASVPLYIRSAGPQARYFLQPSLYHSIKKD